MADARFVLGVDLDGVVADFYGGLRPIAAEWLGVSMESLTSEVHYSLPEWQLERAGGYDALHRFAVTQRGLFENLKPMEGAPVGLRRLSTKDVRIRIITNRLFIKYFHREAIQQTIDWLEHHGIPYWDLCFMRDKAEVGADLYVEDAPDNIARLQDAGCRTLIFTNSTNRHLDGQRANSWSEVENIVTEQLEQWRRARLTDPQAEIGRR